MTHALLVEFQIKPEHAAQFSAAIAENARLSLVREPGCRQFDVCRDPQDPGAFFLYELYDDPAAIGAHLAAPHFLAFDALTKDWVIGKSIRTYVLAAP